MDAVHMLLRPLQRASCAPKHLRVPCVLVIVCCHHNLGIASTAWLCKVWCWLPGCKVRMHKAFCLRYTQHPTSVATEMTVTCNCAALNCGSHSETPAGPLKCAPAAAPPLAKD